MNNQPRPTQSGAEETAQASEEAATLANAPEKVSKGPSFKLGFYEGRINVTVPASLAKELGGLQFESFTNESDGPRLVVLPGQGGRGAKRKNDQHCYAFESLKVAELIPPELFKKSFPAEASAENGFLVLKSKPQAVFSSERLGDVLKDYR